jgi:hypothetical protein
MAALARVNPGATVQAFFHGFCHQLVVRGVKVYLVDPVAKSVMGVKHRFVGVGLKSQINGAG